MAGRNISASHVAFTSTRVMATCATMGQAAGTVAAWCSKNGCEPADILKNKQWLEDFQQLLLKTDQSLLAVRNEDPYDLARAAHVTASAETANGPAISVIDGWNRDVGDGKTHQWQSGMQGCSPWIMLQWERAQTINEIQLTFDTALHKRLFLTGEDSEFFYQQRGAQPEAVKKYVVEALSDDGFVTVISNDHNFLRLVNHKIEPLTTCAIRVTVHQTNGDDLARIFEIRCYGG
jgi:hypothetical protein